MKRTFRKLYFGFFSFDLPSFKVKVGFPTEKHILYHLLFLVELLDVETGQKGYCEQLNQSLLDVAFILYSMFNFSQPLISVPKEAKAIL